MKGCEIMDEFVCLNYKIDIAFMEMSNSFNGLIFDNYFTESTNEASFFDKMIERAKKIIEEVKNKVNELVTKVTVKQKLDSLKEAIKKNPVIGNKKIKMTDYDKLEQLNNAAAKELEKTNDVENMMKKYRTQRNKLLAASAAITISLGAALVFITKRKEQKNKNLDQSLSQSQKRISRLKAKYTNLKGENESLNSENDKLKNKIKMYRASTPAEKAKIAAQQTGNELKKKGEKFATGVDIIKNKAQAETEILSNTTKDLVNSVKDTLTVCGSEASALKKIGSVTKGTGEIIGAGARLISGETKNNVNVKNKEKLRSDIRSISSKIEKAKSILSDKSQSAETRQRAKKYIDSATAKLKRQKAVYKSID